MNRPSTIKREDGLWLLRRMRLIRQASQRIAALYPSNVMETPVHLCIGQEAVPVGVCRHLRDADKLFLGHRTHGPALAKGLPLPKLMAELYGRTTGCSHGHGGSMHLLDLEHGLPGSSAIVGGSIALGVGAGLAAQLTGADYVGVSYFGDAATNAGVFYESLNFAALRKLPVLFVCEDNRYSATTRTGAMTAGEGAAARARSVGIDARPVDGNDVEAVHAAAAELVSAIRRGHGPRLLHAHTYRAKGHVSVDPAHYRDPDEVRKALVGDPIELARRRFVERGGDIARLDAIDREAREEIAAAQAAADAAPFPDAALAFTDVQTVGAGQWH